MNIHEGRIISNRLGCRKSWIPQCGDSTDEGKEEEDESVDEESEKTK